MVQSVDQFRFLYTAACDMLTALVARARAPVPAKLRTEGRAVVGHVLACIYPRKTNNAKSPAACPVEHTAHANLLPFPRFCSDFSHSDECVSFPSCCAICS